MIESYHETSGIDEQ